MILCVPLKRDIIESQEEEEEKILQEETVVQLKTKTCCVPIPQQLLPIASITNFIKCPWITASLIGHISVGTFYLLQGLNYTSAAILRDTSASNLGEKDRWYFPTQRKFVLKQFICVYIKIFTSMLGAKILLSNTLIPGNNTNCYTNVFHKNGNAFLRWRKQKVFPL